MSDETECAEICRQTTRHASRGRAREMFGLQAESDRLENGHEQESVQAKRMIDMDVHVLLHELRTPLNAIMGFSRLVEPKWRELCPAATAEWVGHIEQSAGYMLALIQAYERSLQGPATRSDRTDAICIHEAVRAAICLLDPQARQRRLAFVVHGDTDSRLLVGGPSLHVQQILANILSNAVKYSGEGGSIVITHELDVVNRRTGTAIVRVSNGGPGMTKDQLERLFRPFERAGQEASPIDGRGLGLFLTRKLMLELGGTVSIDSEPMGTTIVTLRFPLV